jgi:hypothetical protein
MGENNRVNEDLANIISSFEKRTQQISEEQREARERFVVALSELSRQYDLLREWTEKSNADLKDFFAKLGTPQQASDLLDPLSAIGDKLDLLNEHSSKIPQTIEKELQALGEKFGGEKEQEKLLQPIMVIADRIDQIAQEFAQSLATTENGIKESLATFGELKQLDELVQGTRSISEQMQAIPEGLSSAARFTELLEHLSNDVSTQLGEVRALTSDIKYALDDIPLKLAESNEKLVVSLASSKELFDSLAETIRENNEKLVSSLGAIKEPFDSLTATMNENNGKVMTLISEMVDSFNAYATAFNESNERLLTTLEEANTTLIAKQGE